MNALEKRLQHKARVNAERFVRLTYGAERVNQDMNAEARNSYIAGWLEGWDSRGRTEAAHRLRKRARR